MSIAINHNYGVITKNKNKTRKPEIFPLPPGRDQVCMCRGLMFSGLNYNPTRENGYLEAMIGEPGIMVSIWGSRGSIMTSFSQMNPR